MAANASLDDIKAVGRGTPDQIAHIRRLYMSNTGLPLDQQTYGIDNSKIVLASYFGLLQIGILQKEDKKMLCRYMLHMVATGEEIVHKELLYRFCENSFADVRDGIVNKYEQRKRNWIEEAELIRGYKKVCAAKEILKQKPRDYFIPGRRIRKAYDVAKAYVNAELGCECEEFVCQQLDEQCSKEIAQVCAKRAEHLLNGNLYLEA